MQPGFYRYPTVHRDRVIFVSEDDLWETSLSGGFARRLTNGTGLITRPIFSPDGEHIAFSSTEEGATDIYVASARAEGARRLTFDSATAHVVGWSEDGEQVIISSRRGAAHRRNLLYSVPVRGGAPTRLPVGEAEWYSADSDRRVIGRHRTTLTRWKRYRGGLAGEIWVDASGDDNWTRLFSDTPGGFVQPFWIEDRVWFISDIEGHANLYSCAPDGSDRTRHTSHTGFTMTDAHTDGATIVYSIGGELRRYDIASGEDSLIEIDYASPRAQMQRKFVDPIEYLDDYALHPSGHYVSLTSRGKAFNMGLWEGAVRQTGAPQGVRYRLGRYTHDGEEIVFVSDRGGEENLELHSPEGLTINSIVLDGAPLGRPLEVIPSPTQRMLAITNHKQELLLVNLETRACKLVDHSEHDRITGCDWSPCGTWLTYAKHDTQSTSKIMLHDLSTSTTHAITSGEFVDSEPVFDPEGRYIYFVSYREFNPIYGNLFFELSLNRGQKPCLITLREEIESPLISKPKPLEDKDDDLDDEDEDAADDASTDGATEDASAESPEGDTSARDDSPTPIEIDLDGIEARVIALPVGEAHYDQLAATSERLYYITSAPRGARGPDLKGGTLRYWDLKAKRSKKFHSDVESYTLSADRKTIALWTEETLRAMSAAGGPPDDEDEDDKPSRESGWLDLDRVSVEVDPRTEYKQMAREVWRLMRDNFWREDMSGVDWDEVWERYEPALARVNARSEFSALIWEMQGELGTSHAYEIGGDYPSPRRYDTGLLGADVAWTDSEGNREPGWQITHIPSGDDWHHREGSPLNRPGLDVAEGDVIVAINGRRLTRTTSPQSRLVNLAGEEVELIIQRHGEEETDTITVKSLMSDAPLRYRAWVKDRRRRVHELSEGRVGYVHIPDMGPNGYAEFHRAYNAERARDALVIDVRYNGGGHVSSLILEKLRREPIGYDLSRHSSLRAYPDAGPRGPMVCLTNEYAGSDGDIFSHCFKLYGLGPLIGKRTWGGVIGIWPRHELVDGSITTQPEFSFWFEDVGFGVENFGTTPDIEVELDPASDARGDDVQLEAAVDKVLELLESSTKGPPESFAPFPNLAAPDEL